MGFFEQDMLFWRVFIERKDFFCTDTKGDVKIADFGVSRRMMGQTTLFTQSIGTICWMAIESLQGEMVKYKKSSDIQVHIFTRHETC